MNKITASLEANELIEKLTWEVVNLLYLGSSPDDPEGSKLESTIALVAEAWELPQEAIDKSKEIIATELEAINCLIRGEQAQKVIQQDKILQSDGGGEIMAILWGLFEAAIRLGAQEKREQILQSAQFIAEYLGLEEWLTDSNRPAAKRLA